MAEHPVGQWYAHDITTIDNRPVWHSEVRVNVGPAAYETVALCRRVTEQRKDAALIASAPALMAALEALLNFEGHLADCNGPLMRGLECSEECEQAGAALALARGEVPS